MYVTHNACHTMLITCSVCHTLSNKDCVTSKLWTKDPTSSLSLAALASASAFCFSASAWCLFLLFLECTELAALLVVSSTLYEKVTKIFCKTVLNEIWDSERGILFPQNPWLFTMSLCIQNFVSLCCFITELQTKTRQHVPWDVCHSDASMRSVLFHNTSLESILFAYCLAQDTYKHFCKFIFCVWEFLKQVQNQAVHCMFFDDVIRVLNDDVMTNVGYLQVCPISWNTVAKVA